MKKATAKKTKKEKIFGTTIVEPNVQLFVMNNDRKMLTEVITDDKDMDVILIRFPLMLMALDASKVGCIEYISRDLIENEIISLKRTSFIIMMKPSKGIIDLYKDCMQKFKLVHEHNDNTNIVQKNENKQQQFGDNDNNNEEEDKRIIKHFKENFPEYESDKKEDYVDYLKRITTTGKNNKKKMN